MNFSKTQRLTKKSQYDAVFVKAKKASTAEFTILFRTNSLGHARLGIALSKKNVPKAHDRNRIKRLVRENFRTLNLPAVDLVVMAKPKVKDLENKSLIIKLGILWERLVCLCKD